MKDDRLTLVYADGNIRVELGKILTNKSISIDDALRILGIDMEVFADKQGWDGWNWECLHLISAVEIDPIIGYEYQCRDGLPCYYNQGIDYQSGGAYRCGPCGQQNCWYSQLVRDYNNVTLIPLAEYATMHGKAESSARRKAIRGGFKSAKKIGRNWVIDRDEPYTDLRKKPE